MVFTFQIFEIEILALDAPHAFQGDTFVGGHFHAGAQDAVVDAEILVFVGSQCQSRAELFIESTGSHLDKVVFIVGKIVGDAMAFIANILKVDQRVKIKLVPHAGSETTIGILQVHVRVGSHLRVHLVGPDQ